MKLQPSPLAQMGKCVYGILFTCLLRTIPYLSRLGMVYTEYTPTELIDTVARFATCKCTEY